MKAISAYMANRSAQRNGEEGRRSEYGGSENRRNEYGGSENRRSEYDERTNAYNRRSEMDEGRPEDTEMRRRRDSRGRYMMGEDLEPESRYRGRDGRWKAGRRRSEYDGGMRMEDEEEGGEEREGRAIQWPYAPGLPHIPAENRMIGFGKRTEYETRSHYDGGKAAAKVGGTMWMEPISEEDEELELDRVTAERWVQGMKNEDPARPKGPRWSMEEVKPHAMKFGVDAEGEELVEFWAVMNAMFSDYSGVAKRFNITSPEFYAMMAKAWMDDKDAVPNKTAMYYKCCVKKE